MLSKLFVSALLLWHSPRVNAIMGYGIDIFNPVCCFACRSLIGQATLDCTVTEPVQEIEPGFYSTLITTPACWTSDVSFLTTLALCIDDFCNGTVEPWRLEEYWAARTTGNPDALPMWSYGETRIRAHNIIGNATPQEYIPGDTLNYTASLSAEALIIAQGTFTHYDLAQMRHSTYGIIILVAGFATPLVLSLFTRLPFMSSVADQLRPYLIYPFTVPGYHSQPLPFLLGNPPTLGQTWYIALLVILNIVLTAVGYELFQPSFLYNTRSLEIINYIGQRTGVIAFALAPLTILFSGRNNILLWFTNWHHSTFLLLHRWTGRLFTIQAVIHSILYLVIHVENGNYTEELTEDYWIWGCVATVAASAMLIFSVLWIRQIAYEAFLIFHILLAVFTLAGCWYHVDLLYMRRAGYERWLYAAFAVWGLERALRLLRIFKAGIRHATVTNITKDIVRIDIEGIAWHSEPGTFAFAYFPGVVPWRPWENHPFSVLSTKLLQGSPEVQKEGSGEASEEPSPTSPDLELDTSSQVVKAGSRDSSGITFYIRGMTGLTSHLSSQTNITALLDGPYGSQFAKDVLLTDRLILIGGGVGITGLVDFEQSHHNAKLYWCMKQDMEGLARDLAPAMDGMRETEIQIGKRLDIDMILETEVKDGWKKIGVVVCGPSSMCDHVRATVARLGRQEKAIFQLEVEIFSY